MPELSIEELPILLGPGESPVILEIGANDGSDTGRFVKTFPLAWVHCFEPDPRAIAKWRARWFAALPRVTLHEVALSDENAEGVPFWQSGGIPPNYREPVKDWDKSGSLCRPTGHREYSPWCTFREGLTVRTVTLDAWHVWSGLPPTRNIDFIWLDVQGAEAQVLRGATGTLPRVRYVYLECHRRELYEGQPTLDELKTLLPGFELAGEYSGDNYLFHNLAFSAP